MWEGKRRGGIGDIRKMGSGKEKDVKGRRRESRGTAQGWMRREWWIGWKAGVRGADVVGERRGYNAARELGFSQILNRCCGRHETY